MSEGPAGPPRRPAQASRLQWLGAARVRRGAPRRGAFGASCAPRRAPCGSLPLSCLRGFVPLLRFAARPGAPSRASLLRVCLGPRPVSRPGASGVYHVLSLPSRVKPLRRRRETPPLTELPNVIPPRQAPMAQKCAIGTTFQQSSIMPLITCKFAATDRTCNRFFAILSSILRRLVPFGSASSVHKSYNNPISCAVNITIYFILSSKFTLRKSISHCINCGNCRVCMPQFLLDFLQIAGCLETINSPYFPGGMSRYD